MVGISSTDVDINKPHLFRSSGYYVFAGKSELHGQDGTTGRKNPHLGSGPARKLQLRFEAEPRPMLHCAINDGAMGPLSFDRPIPMGEWRPAILYDRGGIQVNLVIRASPTTYKPEVPVSAKLWD